MKRTVLVADDEQTILKTLDKVLSAAGYSVVLASNGKDALDISIREEIKVFLLDIVMPGMDGLQLCREIKKKIGQECVVYALTGHVGEYDVESCREAGFDDYFVKPFKIAMMLKMIAAAFEKVERWKKSGKSK